MSEPKAKLWVQGIVAARPEARPGEDPPVEPLVQFRQEMEDGTEIGWQQSVDLARDHAREVLEAAANATYEAAFVEWLLVEQEVDQVTAFRSLQAFRIWRRDRWGQPDIEDWRNS